MTAPDPATTTVGDGTTARGRARARWRRYRPAAVVLALVVVVAAAGVLALPRTGTGALDPDSAEPQGARALAQVLQDRGVDVVRAGRVQEAVAAAGPGTTLLVVGGDILAPDRLAELAAAPADLVLVEPDGPVLDALAPSLVPAGPAGAEIRPARCDDPDAVAAGEALAGGRLVAAAGDAPVTLCFPDAQDADAGSYAVTTGAVTASGERTVRVIGQGDLLSNAHLAQDGNAALALRALGGQPRLVWLVASPLDTTADADVTATDLLPRWVPWVALWLGVVTVLAMVWRGRRLGRLVAEPLPVVVRSAETAQGRASLYRAAGAHDRAAAVLRAATMRRLAGRLGLPASASGEAVAAAAARATGRDAAGVRTLLLGPQPVDGTTSVGGRALVTLADDLDHLAADVLRAPSREAVHP